jgi:hypothetical protein
MTPLDRVLTRVRKLLALATSSNEHEAASAAAMAAALMEQHALDEAMLGGGLDAPTLDPDALAHGRRLASWRIWLATSLASANGCRLAHRRDHPGSSVLVIGRAADVATVRYLYAYCVRAIDGLVARWPGHGAAWRNNYRMGVIDTINRRMREARDATRARLRATGGADVERAIVRVDARLADASRVLDAITQGRGRNVSQRGLTDHDARRRGQHDGYTIALDHRAELGAPPLALPAPQENEP